MRVATQQVLRSRKSAPSARRVPPVARARHPAVTARRIPTRSKAPAAAESATETHTTPVSQVYTSLLQLLTITASQSRFRK